jgi:hypothetical protein
VVDLNASPARASAAAHPRSTSSIGGATMVIGGIVLALIIAIAAFAAVRGRRRRREEQEWADEQSRAYEPFETAQEPEREVYEEQPAIVAPEASAFVWGNEPREREDSRPVEDDRRPGETWVERAYRGPSPLNPSVSLKARLKRAAFFDKRERDAAAGLAEPVDPSAGLPDSMIEDEQRELA